MVNQNHPKSISEAKLEKEKEENKTLMSSPLTTILFYRHDDDAKSPWENTSTKGNALIPRVMVTNIMVYAISTDIHMVQSSRRNYINNNQVTNNNSNVANEGLTSIRTAILEQNRDKLKTILKQEPDLLKCTDEDGLTPLSFAAYYGCSETVAFFLRKFPESMKTRNRDDSYPVHKACLGGHIEILQTFYSRYSKSLLSVDGKGKTIVYLASEKRGNKLKEVVSYLLSLPEVRELVNEKDENGNTALMLAEKNGNLEVQQLIMMY